MKNAEGKLNILDEANVAREIVALVRGLGIENEVRELLDSGMVDDAVLLRHADGKEVSEKPWRGQKQTESLCTNPNPIGKDGEFGSGTESPEESLIRSIVAKRRR